MIDVDDVMISEGQPNRAVIALNHVEICNIHNHNAHLDGHLLLIARQSIQIV